MSDTDAELSTARETGLADQDEGSEVEPEGESTENFTTPRPNQGGEPS